MIKVYYPEGGRRFLLHWWTQDERGHVVLAETEAGLRSAALRVSEEHSEAEIRDVCEIELVAPSALMEAWAETHRLRESIEFFHTEIVFWMKEAVEAKKLLPKPFAVCETYEDADDEEESSLDSEDTKAWKLESHSGCRRCRDGIRLMGVTIGDLYAREHERWRLLHPERGHVDPKRLVSRGLPAKDDELLWYAEANFGHHAGGVVLAKVNLEEIESYSPGYLSDRLMFLFRRLRELDSTKAELETLFAQAKAKDERDYEGRGARDREKREREHQRNVDEAIEFFASGDKRT